MKKIYIFIAILSVQILLSFGLAAQCLTATGGQWPSATFTPSCTGTAETIVTDGWAGEYSLVNVTTGITYIFKSSVTTDFITVSNSGGTTAFTSGGGGSVTWASTLTGVVRFYTHTNSACGEANVDRTRSIQCTIPTCSGTPLAGTAATATPFICSATTATLTLSGQSAGVTLQWQSSPAGAGTWADVTTGSGGSTATYTSGTISASTDFRCKVTCSNGGALAYSTVATVTLSSVPTNDDVCSAITLILNGAAVCSNTTCATSTGDPTAASNGSTPNNTVWYKYTPTTTGLVNFVMTRPAGVNAGLLYGWLDCFTATGSCPTLTFTEVTPGMASYDLTANTTVTLTSPVLTAGTTYYFMVDGFSGAKGAYCIQMITPPTPPICTTSVSPANNATNVSAPAAPLTWNAAANATSYDVYFGTTNPPVLLGSIAATTVTITGLTVSTVYYWYIVPTNAGGAAVGCATTQRQFTTQSFLPITLASFKGNRQGSSNILSWTTVTEINNAGFELERSIDGVNFSSLSFITSKAVNGNSNGNLTYTFTDTKSLTTGLYYRLKQMDKDGKSTLSQIVFIKGVKTTKLELVSIYPNPVAEQLNLSIVSPKVDNVTFIVSDLAGKLIITKLVSVINGDNNVQLNVSSLAKGTYTIKAICADGCETAISKFIKQ